LLENLGKTWTAQESLKSLRLGEKTSLAHYKLKGWLKWQLMHSLSGARWNLDSENKRNEEPNNLYVDVNHKLFYIGNTSKWSLNLIGQWWRKEIHISNGVNYPALMLEKPSGLENIT